MTTRRAALKESRRGDLLRGAAALFARRGFAGVSTTELGDAVGMSGPALYKYFASKDALLAELLIDASERLLAGGRSIRSETADPDAALTRLIAFHLDFATTEPDVIRVQDRELATLDEPSRHAVRSLQRQYVQVWDDVLAPLLPGASVEERLTRLLAVFGLLNSTPHSARSTPHSDRSEATSDVLAAMAAAALTA